ncbi:MAG TPA: BadF/BadG/BcrA/BcrD ATPase family protein [Thermoanaerobaculia bacterium]|nr:BadF/BadG/BcrA/BcrD ATPase family protein [Thermoanaerobaculia bacterium]
MDDLYLGVDGGGSKTAADVVDSTLHVLGEGTGGPSNYLRVGMTAAVEELRKAVLDAAAAAKVDFSTIRYCYLGIAGADHPRHRAALVEELRKFFPHDNFTVDSDARIALTAAVGLGAGIVVIAGTGSVAFGRNAANREARAGGWGPTLGDEGSGYSIARRGLAAIVKAFDGRGPATLMTDVLCNEYGMCKPEDLPFFVYAPTTHADDIARCFKMVLHAAEQGDDVARRIFAEEGAELGMTALTVARRLGLQNEAFRVACVGGAFKAGPLLAGPFSERLLAGAPLADLQPPRTTPVIGAAEMAIRASQAPRIR